MTAKIKTLPTSTSHKHRPKGVSTKQFEKVHWPFLPAWAVFIVGTIAAGAAEFGITGAICGGLSATFAAIALAL